MGAGITVNFCNHFEGLREKVESEAEVKATLIPVYLERDDCWISSLVTKQFLLNKPTRSDLHDCLIKMRGHAVENTVLEIHITRLGAGLDGLNWNITKQMILETF